MKKLENSRHQKIILLLGILAVLGILASLYCFFKLSPSWLKQGDEVVVINRVGASEDLVKFLKQQKSGCGDLSVDGKSMDVILREEAGILKVQPLTGKHYVIYKIAYF